MKPLYFDHFDRVAAPGAPAEDNRALLALSRRLIRGGMTLLTPLQRQTLQWYYFEGRTIREIAALRGCCPSTVSRSLKSARLRLHFLVEAARRSGLLEEEGPRLP